MSMEMGQGIKPLLPGSTIGLLGGGQLGRMIILEGKKMGYRFVTLDPLDDCPGSQVADRHITAGYDDLEAARLLAESSDLITYEFENVDDAVVKVLDKDAFLPQGGELLRITRHRVREKRALEAAGVPVAPYRAVQSREELLSGSEALGFPCVLKTATGGYDGKGQWVFQSMAEAEAFTQLEPGREYVLEQWVPFDKEISVIAARSIMGEVAIFPPAWNIHRKQILHQSIVPAPVESGILRHAEDLARQIAEGLNVRGLIAVEMFLLHDGSLLVNELAPRPHNSGHYTLDACAVSQFEQQIRALSGLPLGSPKLLTPAVMVNILGEDVDRVRVRMTDFPPQVKVHWYGKRESRPGRKMGHLTVLGESTEEALATVCRLELMEPTTRRGVETIR
ncbi:5-(carboxyamino)imidazole ribonucleotide synthase [Kroppenstedtia eburnea]|uniref:5-(carboxyamino)imidazole ribonucleotide synthase n=1 Tax=Kroppenstedtia eburnea TaxID=714067 RepID=UPI0036402C26